MRTFKKTGSGDQPSRGTNRKVLLVPRTPPGTKTKQRPCKKRPANVAGLFH